MNVYTNKTFEGHHPVGTAAVVVAVNQSQAASLLEQELIKHGLFVIIKPEEMILVDRTNCNVQVLSNGDY